MVVAHAMDLLALALAGGRAVVGAATVDPVAHLVTEQIVSLLQESFTQRGVTGMIWAGVVALAGVVPLSRADVVVTGRVTD